MQLHRVSDLREKVDDVWSQLRSQILTMLPGAEIHHVGATALDEGWTKGDVDACVRVAPEDFTATVQVLSARYDVAQRHNWTHEFASFSAASLPLPAGVQVVVRDSENDVMVWFRRALADHRELALAYDRCKRDAAGATDPGEYWRAKNAFITRLLCDHSSRDRSAVSLVNPIGSGRDGGRIVRLALVPDGPVDIRKGSGTAVAIMRLRRALVGAGISAPLLSPRPADVRALAAWAARVRAPAKAPPPYDAILGINGAGYSLVANSAVPFVALIKALYAGAVTHESGLPRLRLREHMRRERSGAQHADAVIVPSRFAADSVIARYGVDAARVHVVPEPFDLDQWRAALPKRPRRGTRVLCVAHLYPRKRLIDLLRAWPLVRAVRPDARLDIVGAGPELRRLERSARDLEGCYLHGFAGGAALLEFYARADCFCLPSAQETFGYSVVEAMASGLPVVVAAAGSLPEICAGAVGDQVPWRASRALAGALVRALGEPVRTAAATTNPELTRRFAPSAVAGQTLEIVERAREVAQRRAAGNPVRRSGARRYSSTAARMSSLRPASESAKKPPS